MTEGSGAPIWRISSARSRKQSTSSLTGDGSSQDSRSLRSSIKGSPRSSFARKLAAKRDRPLLTLRAVGRETCEPSRCVVGRGLRTSELGVDLRADGQNPVKNTLL